MSAQSGEDEPTLTVEQVNDLVGDDIGFWLANPFMTPDMLAEKVCWWVTRARSGSPAGDQAGDDRAAGGGGR